MFRSTVLTLTNSLHIQNCNNCMQSVILLRYGSFLNKKNLRPRNAYMNKKKFSKKFSSEDNISIKDEGNLSEKHRLEVQCSILANKLILACQKLAEPAKLEFKGNENQYLDLKAIDETTYEPETIFELQKEDKSSEHKTVNTLDEAEYETENNVEIGETKNSSELKASTKLLDNDSYLKHSKNILLTNNASSEPKSEFDSMNKSKPSINLSNFDSGEESYLKELSKYIEDQSFELAQTMSEERDQIKDEDKKDKCSPEENSEKTLTNEIFNQLFKELDHIEYGKISKPEKPNLSQNDDFGGKLEKLATNNKKFEQEKNIVEEEKLFSQNKNSANNFENEKYFQEFDLGGESEELKRKPKKLANEPNLDLKIDKFTLNKNSTESFKKYSPIEDCERFELLEIPKTKRKSFGKKTNTILKNEKSLPEMKVEPLEEKNMFVDIDKEPSENKINAHVQELKMEYNKLTELEKIRVHQDKLSNIPVVKLIDDDEDFKAQFENKRNDKHTESKKLLTQFEFRPLETESNFPIMDEPIRRARELVNIKCKSNLSNFIRLKEQSRQLSLKILQDKGKQKQFLKKVEITQPNNKPKVKKYWITKAEYESDYQKRCARQQIGRSLREECRKMVNTNTFSN